MAQFVEKNLGHSRRKIFKQMDTANITDIPMQLHVLKSESMKELDLDELETVQND